MKSWGVLISFCFCVTLAAKQENLHSATLCGLYACLNAHLSNQGKPETIGEVSGTGCRSEVFLSVCDEIKSAYFQAPLMCGFFSLSRSRLYKTQKVRNCSPKHASEIEVAAETDT